MSEDYDYDPGDWKGHDFKSARRTYDSHAGRSYSDAKSKRIAASDLFPAKLTTESTAPLTLMVDVTGSMGSWPATMFSKLPYLELEGKEYLGDDMEICFCAVGDTTCDSYPLQVREFKAGTALKEELTKLVIEGGGGGGARESYEMGALYHAINANLPRAIKPIFIFIADEAPYDRVTKRDAMTYAKVELQGDISTEDIFDMLKAKYEVYLVHKHYADGGHTRRHWVELIGEDHIADLQDPERVVDVIFGILAKETGRIDYFKHEIEERQNDHQVDTVYKALKTVHRLGSDDTGPALLGSGKSTLHRPSAGKKTTSLI